MTWGVNARYLFQSTLPARGATADEAAATTLQEISIHAPCTGSDALQEIKAILLEISIHAPCTGSDRVRSRLLLPPAYFNPRSLHGERQSSKSNV